MARVIFDHITKRYGSVMAVNDLYLEIADGEFLVLVGPSGCGKTTSLRILAGLEEFSEGSVVIGNRIVDYLTPAERDIAMVYQNYALYPHMTVYENMAFCLHARKMAKCDCDAKVFEAAEILGIRHLLERRPKQISDGQKQRVALGRAIVREPQVFLMDEPLSNLDAKQRVTTRAELSRLHRRLQTTFVYVTHDQLEAMTMGTRIAVMRDGVLQQVDTPRIVYHTPVNLFVAEFIGSPAINLLPVQLTGTADEMFLEGSGFQFRVPPQKTAQLRDFLGKSIIAGFRPEDIHDCEELPGGLCVEVVQAEADVVEFTGPEVFLYALVDSKTVVSRVSPRTAAVVGNKVGLAFDMNKALFFDPTTELAIH